MRTRWWPAALVVWMACSGNLFTLTVEETAETQVEKGTILEDLAGRIGFEEFVTMDLTSSQELQNQGVAPGDIREVFLEELSLTAIAPEGGDLSFIEEIAFFVEAPGLDRVRIAWQDTFPEGEAYVAMNLEDVDLTDHVVSESMTFDTEVTGRRPEETTTVEAYAAFSVGVTRQGACAGLEGG